MFFLIGFYDKLSLSKLLYIYNNSNFKLHQELDMKKVLISCLLLGSFAFAEMESDPKKVIVMRSLETAMGMIEKGFLRNNANMVKLGAKNLKKNLISIDSFIVKSDEKGFNPHVYASTEAKAITALADKIITNFKAGNNDEARDAFDKTLSRCLACHRIIRQW